MAGTSRMSREAHVRICGGLVVRFLRCLPGGKGPARRDQVRIKETNTSEPLITCRKQIDDVKTEGLHCLGISSDGTCLQAEWHPVWRRRELDSGFHVQRGNLSFRW